MRCPKCGFISFDHLTSCAKCGRDISQVATELQGTSIKVDPPMFLGAALAAFSESGASFDEHAMEADVDQGIDFDMAMEEEAEEPTVAAGAEAEVDFSFEDEAIGVEAEAEPEMTLAEPEPEDAALAAEEAEAVASIELEAEIEAEPDATDDSFEELDFLGVVDDEEEGGLEFDLEDFIADMDDDKSGSSGSEDASEIDIDLADEEK